MQVDFPVRGQHPRTSEINNIWYFYYPINYLLIFPWNIGTIQLFSGYVFPDNWIIHLLSVEFLLKNQLSDSYLLHFSFKFGYPPIIQIIVLLYTRIIQVIIWITHIHCFKYSKIVIWLLSFFCPKVPPFCFHMRNLSVSGHILRQHCHILFQRHVAVFNVLPYSKKRLLEPKNTSPLKIIQKQSKTYQKKIIKKKHFKILKTNS